MPYAGTSERERASGIVAELAARLADPDAVAAVASAPDNLHDALPRPVPVWLPDTLGEGHPGVALLFAELAATDPAMRRAAHGHLAAASRAIGGVRTQLFMGAASVGYAGHVAAASYGGYTAMLERLDEHVATAGVRQASAYRDDVETGRSPGGGRLDLISGITGVGRYLLARGLAEPLAEVLACLVAAGLAPDVRVDGVPVAACWSSDNAGGGVDLGIAHGVSGPLALLALSWRAGVRVGGQDAAIERIVGILDRWLVEDDAGPYWPAWVSVADHREPPERTRGRDAWCYGAGGISRALFLAGAALDRPDWRKLAIAALRGAVQTADYPAIRDAGLCHGWSGLLQITVRMAGDTGDPGLWSAADALAVRTMDDYDAECPFGFRYAPYVAPRPADRPGFVGGAAGIALALHTYAAGEPPRTPWDAALLLA
ncbi:lanthionine synthetase C family protein [Fodinicola acaciae]|uniref:lanthionine synthetase C family protein n=1 Tax=Fodinicola acaciae TaxID=2681555 RepID=UPI0013D87137|nr:lanthionine synthetase C family protein [Fodinicola acaciae]